MKIAEILKDSDYKLEIFSEEAIKNLEARITNKHNMGGGIELLCHLFGTR